MASEYLPLPSTGDWFPLSVSLETYYFKPTFENNNPKHALRLAGQFSETLFFLFMMNGILQWMV
ncbi:hypothetical protein Hanom_Chr12g01145931 [Helianthus anomalus]